MEMSVKQVIETNQWLQDLFADMPRRFIAQLELITVPAGHKIITKGTENPFVYILYAGNNRVINEFNNGRVFEFSSTRSTNRSGRSLSGLLEFFSGYSIATTTIEAAEKSSYIRIRKSVLSRWLDEDSHALKKLVRIFAQQLYPSINSHGKMVVYSGYYSLVNFIYQQYGRKVQPAEVIIVKETREAICQELGMSIRTMYRLCRELVDRDMASIIKKKITISAVQMERISGFLKREEDLFDQI